MAVYFSSSHYIRKELSSITNILEREREREREERDILYIRTTLDQSSYIYKHIICTAAASLFIMYKTIGKCYVSSTSWNTRKYWKLRRHFYIEAFILIIIAWKMFQYQILRKLFSFYKIIIFGYSLSIVYLSAARFSLCIYTSCIILDVSAIQISRITYSWMKYIHSPSNPKGFEYIYRRATEWR